MTTTIAPTTCECGCGQTPRPGRRYLHGHSGYRAPRLDVSHVKTCNGCDRELPVENFQADASMPSGLQSKCKECRAVIDQQTYDAHPERWFKNRLLREFGITVEDYEAMLAAQGGVCAICAKECRSGRRLAVDHDHVTGVVRGLLCLHCNLALGKFDDDPERIERALAYLRGAR